MYKSVIAVWFFLLHLLLVHIFCLSKTTWPVTCVAVLVRDQDGWDKRACLRVCGVFHIFFKNS